MNRLRIAIVPWPGRADDGSPYELRLWDFLIDGRPLAGRLGLSRAGLDLCNSPLEVRDHAFAADDARQLVGLALGGNQLQTGRVVLYGCHCGCDYCGVVSARVVPDAGVIRWAAVGYEGGGGPRAADDFRFRTRQAAATVAGFLRRRRAPAAGRPRGPREVP